MLSVTNIVELVLYTKCNFHITFFKNNENSILNKTNSTSVCSGTKYPQEMLYRIYTLYFRSEENLNYCVVPQDRRDLLERRASKDMDYRYELYYTEL